MCEEREGAWSPWPQLRLRLGPNPAHRFSVSGRASPGDGGEHSPSQAEGCQGHMPWPCLAARGGWRRVLRPTHQRPLPPGGTDASLQPLGQFGLHEEEHSEIGKSRGGHGGHEPANPWGLPCVEVVLVPDVCEGEESVLCPMPLTSPGARLSPALRSLNTGLEGAGTICPPREHPPCICHPTPHTLSTSVV